MDSSSSGGSSRIRHFGHPLPCPMLLVAPQPLLAYHGVVARLQLGQTAQFGLCSDDEVMQSRRYV